MAQSNVVLLENARSARERAEKARRLSRGLVDAQTVAELRRYADELEAKAENLERLAADLGKTVKRTRELTKEVKGALEAVQQTVDEIMSGKK